MSLLLPLNRYQRYPAYVVVSSVNYLIYDSFTTSLAAGSVNASLAEPGLSTRVVVDTNLKLSISGGNLVLATAGVGNGNPGLWLDLITRRLGRMFLGECTTGSGRYEIGYDGNQTDAPYDCIRFNGTTLEIRDAAIVIAVGAITTATSYQIAVINRRPGCFFFIKGGAFTNWTLLYHSSTSQTSDFELFPTIQGFTNSVATFSNIRVPVDLWVPTPVVSDGFSVWGTSDGLGHPEGLINELGVGGSGIAWSNNVGTFIANSGKAIASVLSGGVGVATVNCSKTDVIVSAKVTRAGGTAGIVARYVDANNHVQARHTGANAQLVKVVAGTPTTLIDATATYVANASIRIICEGQKFRLYYNNALVGAEQTIADAALLSATLVGLRSTDTSNTFDDFTCYARGTGAEYSALNSY